MRRGNLLHKQLCYELVGICFTIHNYLGSYRNKKQYCDAIAHGLTVKNIEYEREKVLPISFVGERQGRNRVDFLIDDNVILEIKRVPQIFRNNYHQCMRYLTSSEKELCLLINFYPKSLFVKRILKPKLL
ncbi:MAG: GxxExxY protein [Candidatus Magasanikbacteria bacterium]|uniref:GxxExxY protein n=1 Tax=Candidatus Magasanikbacteria bacterium CG10_big_fil_rev_8_21_14_0_10_38_6 TaxID=1974647 RepID=A0A2M6P1V8_9BACT|nr:GxxExxY protein [Candidatus Magasanikbacteria bacterium]NCS71757.1 GxxExxY protein [Candidatus Magasanikbacteria bacterium]PIR77668.1 MAG: hypothetical protein COU30_01210 [Candidatus Magasanikbacteria bacterium CG10_big_fil_rev_8_21_14_0_10_38_6]